ncbi:hypothetical protein ACP275_01G081200 [Erythranthe tilingii]
MAISELPDEIMIDILSRLPAKSVGKSRCVSKPWRTILSGNQFIKAHLTHLKRTHQQNLIFITGDFSIRTISAIQNDAVSREIELGLEKKWSDVLGSCDGLVLLQNDDEDKFLLNPITMQLVKVPDWPAPSYKDESIGMHGFGYDSSIDDYKIVSVSYHDPREYVSSVVHTFVDVYCVRSGVWKRVGNPPYDIFYFLGKDAYDHVYVLRTPGAYLNGAIHWFASDANERTVIVAFDLAREVFDEMPAPVGVDGNLVPYELVVLGGCLCIYDVQSVIGQANVWIMREYRSAKSWTRLNIECIHEWEMAKPLCCIGDEEVVLVNTMAEALVYNVKEKSLNNMVVDGVPANVLDGDIFVGSLVSPFPLSVAEPA